MAANNAAAVAWTYDIAADLNFLRAGETITITVPVTVSDDNVPPAGDRVG